MGSPEHGSAPYSLLGGQTTRYVVPLPPGSDVDRGELTLRENGGAAVSMRVRLRR